MERQSFRSIRYLLRLRINNSMNAHLACDIIFTQTINCVPTLKILPILSALPLEHNVTSKSVTSAVGKVIAMHDLQSIEELIHKVAQVGPQNSFFNRIAVLYTIGLVLLPLKRACSRRIANKSQPLCTVSITLVQGIDQCASFCFQFAGKTAISKQQCLDSLWNTVESVMKQFGVINKKIDNSPIELRYNNQIMEGGVELPSLLTIQSEKEMVLTYPNSYKAGINLPLYLQLIRKASVKEKRYDFWTMIMKLAEALQSVVDKQHKQDNFYGEILLKDVYVVDGEEIAVEISAHSSSLIGWKERQWSQLSRKIIFNNTSNPVRKDLFQADWWMIALVIIEVIAVRHQILSFSRELREAVDQNRLNPFLQEFFEYLQTERYIMEGPFMKKLKIWLKMKKEGDYYEQQNEINNYSFIQLSEAVQKDNFQVEQIHQSRLPSQKGHVQLRPQAEIQKETKKEEVMSSIDELTLQLMRSLKFNEQLTIFVARRLNDVQIDQLSATIIKADVFFQLMRFNLKPFTTRQGKCPQCHNNTNIYINPCIHDHAQSLYNKNCCGHGKCLNCFLPLIQIASFEEMRDQPYKIKCDNEKCQQELCYPLIRTVIQDNGQARRKYCQLLFKKYAKTHTDVYVYCRQQTCAKFNTIYIKNNSRVLICENCKSSVCIDCHHTPHRPLTCKQFQKQQQEIIKQIKLKMKEMKWPFDQKSQKEEYSRMIQTSLGMENFGDSEIIIKEWLILLSCFKRHGQRGKNTPQSQFLDKMSKTLAWIVKEIQIYIDEKALGAIQCVNLCILLQEVLSQRQKILAFYYSG